MNSVRYMPILKLKMGEVTALKNLDQKYRSILMPLFEIPPIPYDYVTEQPSKTFDKHVEKVGQVVKSCCSDSLFLDFAYVADDATNNFYSNVEEQFLNILEEKITPIPVIYLEMEQEYTNLICSIAKKVDAGICVRIESDDFEDENFADKIEALLFAAGITADRTDIVIDMGLIPSKGIAPLSVGIKNIVRFFPKMRDWRSVTLAATSFPESLASFSSQAATTMERPEWQIWEQLATAESSVRDLFYGDYGIASPEPFQMDPRMMKLGAKIKYTLDESWLIIKGTGIKRGGSAQFHSLAEWLVSSKHYYGADFSWGDGLIGKCAKREVGPGSQTTWVSVGMNHHFAVTAAKLSKLI